MLRSVLRVALWQRFDRQAKRAQALDQQALKFIVGKVVKVARRTNLAALNAVASEHADLFDRRLRSKELAAFLPFVADFVVPFDELFLRDLLGCGDAGGDFVVICITRSFTAGLFASLDALKREGL
jgi:hypothetical protein